MAALFAAAAAFIPATEAVAAEAVLRVVDVGNALCVVAKVPGNHFMLYDASEAHRTECKEAVQDIVGSDKLDLVVISHSDQDHNGELAEILATRETELIVHTGAQLARTIRPNILREFNRRTAVRPESVRNLETSPLPNAPTNGNPQLAPLRIPLGDATVTFVAGWNAWPPDEGETRRGLSPGERKNVISIVVRFEYGGKSVLLTGDTIGRRGSDAEDFCGYAEKWMIQRGNASIDSDVLVGQHHGGNNSSSKCFIEAVSPKFVIFPAGRGSNDHPRKAAVERLFSQALPAHLRVPTGNIFRTDRGDDEGLLEWDGERVLRCKDRSGDDDVEIILSDLPGVDPEVRYRRAPRPCRAR